MMFDRSREEPNDAVFAEASQWLVDFRAGDVDAEGRRRFNAWLCRSPDHIQAYMEAAALWGDIPQLAGNMEVDVEAVVAHARGQRNVTALRTATTAELPAGTSSDGDNRQAGVSSRGSVVIAGRTPRRARRLWAFAAASAAALVLATFVAWWQLDHGTLYTTEIGGQRSITLADGSAIELGARSGVRVRLSSKERSIELIDGQALFRVAPDASRPFIVSSDNARVRAVGTQFDVHKRSSGTVVTVLEGRVAVSAAASSNAHDVEATAGEQVTVPVVLSPKTVKSGGANKDVTHLRTVDVSSMASWTEHTLSFENAPLADVVEEFNRYNERQIALGDSTLESVRISGVFSATKPESLLKFLRDQMSLDVVSGDRRVTIAPPRDKNISGR